jgi:hypothetical protein
MQRRSSKQSVPLKDRHASFVRKEASLLPPSGEREALLNKARRADTTLSQLSDWASSPELQPPK